MQIVQYEADPQHVSSFRQPFLTLTWKVYKRKSLENNFIEENN